MGNLLKIAILFIKDVFIEIKNLGKTY